MDYTKKAADKRCDEMPSLQATYRSMGIALRFGRSGRPSAFAHPPQSAAIFTG